jgi:hypothetical protein
MTIIYRFFEMCSSLRSFPAATVLLRDSSRTALPLLNVLRGQQRVDQQNCALCPLPKKFTHIRAAPRAAGSAE